MHPLPVKPWSRSASQASVALFYDLYSKSRDDWREDVKRYKKIGINAISYGEFWTDIWGWPRSHQEDRLRQFAQDCHAADLKLGLYFGFMISELMPNWQVYGDEITAVDPLMKNWMMTGRRKGEAIYLACYSSKYSDIFLQGVARLIDEVDIDFVYLDGTLTPGPCINHYHGDGFQDSQGAWWPTYNVLAKREVAKRLYKIVKSRKANGIIYTHSSPAYFPTLSFSDIYLAGEYISSATSRIRAKNPKVISTEIVSLAKFRAAYMGKPYGVPCNILFSGLPTEGGLGLSLLHDTFPHNYAPAFDLIEYLNKARLAWSKYVTAESTWMPYWKNQEVVRVTPGELCKVTLQVNHGKHLLAVVMNLGREEQRVELAFRWPALGLKASHVAITDVYSGEQIAFDDLANLPVLGDQFRLLLIQDTEEQ